MLLVVRWFFFLFLCALVLSESQNSFRERCVPRRSQIFHLFIIALVHPDTWYAFDHCNNTAKSSLKTKLICLKSYFENKNHLLKCLKIYQSYMKAGEPVKIRDQLQFTQLIMIFNGLELLNKLNRCRHFCLWSFKTDVLSRMLFSPRLSCSLLSSSMWASGFP